jgi:hypothetical protein
MTLPTNLKQFKEWAKTPGATMVLLDAGKYADAWPAASLAAAKAGRPFAIVQTNGFALASGNPERPNPAWMYFSRGAKDVRFAGDRVSFGHAGDGEPNILTYRMETRI